MYLLATGSESPGTYSDAQGRFRIADVAPGRRSLSASHPGYVGAIRSGIEVSPGQVRTESVSLERLAFGADKAIEFAGIGAVIRVDGDRLLVADVLPSGPAEVAGLTGGDLITHINGTPTAGRGLADNIEDIRGVVGTAVHLELMREGEPLVRRVVRGTVRFNPDTPLGR